MLLKDRTAIITGAARGIGRAIAESLAKEGADIAICDLKAEWAEDTAAAIRALGRTAEVYEVDVSQPEQVTETVNKIVDNFKRVDILVNNAGITRDGLLIRMSDSDWENVLNINLSGCFYFSRAITRHMMKNRYGRIVNIASVIGLIGNAGQANYGASKGGVIALTKSIAKEVAPRGITANAVAPGFIKTAMTDELTEEIKKKITATIPMGRFGLPEDVANVVLFLASDLSCYMTGQVLTISGGMVT
jgi:3-oxoacyl-[acyl-carrier protein] reductase